MRRIAKIVIALSCLQTVTAQNLIPNPSFEEGANQVASWALFAGPGQWETQGRTGERSVSVTGLGDCGAYWRGVSPMPLEPQSLYVLRFWGRGEHAYGGNGLVANCEAAGWRYFIPKEEWLPFGFAAVVPTNVTTSFFRLGQCDMQGKAYLDDVQWRRSHPVHTQFNGVELGIGESVRSKRYSFQTRLTDFFSNYSRPLKEHTAIFGGQPWAGYWTLNSSRYVIYRHDLSGLPFTNAFIGVTFNRYTSGDLVVDVSIDGASWQEQLRFKPPVSGNITTAIETNLSLVNFPAAEIFIRLRASGDMNLSEYRFQADLLQDISDAIGHTWFFEQESPLINVQLLSMANTSTGHVLTASIANPALLPADFEVQQVVSGPSGIWSNTISHVFAAGSSNLVSLRFPGMGPGPNIVSVRVRNQETGEVVMNGDIHTMVSAIHDESYGARLPVSGADQIWWCDSTYKVGQDRAVPSVLDEAIQISAARNEYEPFQLVVRPAINVTNATVTITDFAALGDSNVTIAASNVSVSLVEYVPVRMPTDAAPVSLPIILSTSVGNYPDPLLPLTGEFNLEADINQPLWFTVYVPPHVPAGDYEATITLNTSTSYEFRVRLHVFDFTLPSVTHTKTAYHLTIDDSWHGITNEEQRQQVWDLYLQNFSQHRISPIWPQHTSTAKWSLSGQTVNLNLTDFDEAIRLALDHYRFNGFNLIHMPESMGGYARFTAGYQDLFEKMMKPLATHLREKGWTKEAYMYWYDEPQPTMYPFVTAGMEVIKNSAPDVRRLLTPASVEGMLFRHVDIWTPMLALYDHFPFASNVFYRLPYGEEAWWYVCIAPRFPRPNNFIDYPAVAHRARFWIAERFGITGDLYWQTVHYGGTNGEPRNPYLDAMSGHPGVLLGNGDGLLLYPPTKVKPSSPVISGPVNSLRWELIREALEDGEYFWLLKDLLARRKPFLGANHPAILEAESAYADGMALSATINSFHRDAGKYLVARNRIAAAIEALDDGRPFFVLQPRSQAVRTGETLSLHVEALGWPLPVYQWQRYGTNLPGATSSNLIIASFTPADAGQYRVIASNAMGVTQSSAARIAAFSDFPQFVSEPESLVKHAGEAAVFTACAVSASGVAYQWYYEGQPFTALNSNQPALLITNVSVAHSGDYFVIASNISGIVTSSVARLTVLADSTPPIFVSISSDQGRYVGQSCVLQVEAKSALPLSYQWFYEDEEIWGADSATLYLDNLQLTDSGIYTVVVSNSAGSASAQIQLNVLPLPVLEAAVLPGENQLVLQIPVVVGHQDLLVSTNLVDWSFLKRIQPSQFPTVIAIDNSIAAPAQFYRLQLAD